MLVQGTNYLGIRTYFFVILYHIIPLILNIYKNILVILQIRFGRQLYNNLIFFIKYVGKYAGRWGLLDFKLNQYLQFHSNVILFIGLKLWVLLLYFDQLVYKISHPTPIISWLNKLTKRGICKMLKDDIVNLVYVQPITIQ